MRKTAAFLTLAFLAGGSAAAADSPRETVIPFVSSIRGIEWQAAGKDALYVRGGKGEWYFIRTMNRCARLQQTLAIGLETSALDQLDRHGAILVQGVRCPVASIAPSDGPPRKARRAS
ncbi:MAG: DUF6491 family protein [Allosphingosinicella sp.]